jgi:3-oxoisoapionate kinase
VQLRGGAAPERLAGLAGDDVPVVLLDVLDDETLLEAGRLVWESRGSGLFSASSSGLSYALAAYWRSLGWLPEAAALPAATPVSSIAAVSGSCSPVTAAQIRWARANGFVTERLRLDAALGAGGGAEIERCVAVGAESLGAGRSVVVFSAEGPEDPSVIGFDAIAAQAGLTRADAARRVGEALAQVMRRLLDRVELQRVVVAGGDSSGEVASALGIRALSVAGAMAPGAPLCRAIADDARRDGLEIVLKGGQMGAASFFGAVRAGQPFDATEASLTTSSERKT